MMSRKKIFILLTSLIAFSTALFAKGDTYTYDYWSEIEKSPDVYTVSDVVYADDLKLDVPLKNPTNLFCNGNIVYVLDTDNNRIIELEYTEKRILEFRRVIDKFYSNGELYGGLQRGDAGRGHPVLLFSDRWYCLYRWLQALQ